MSRKCLQDITLNRRGDGVNLRYFLFLSLGIKRTYFPADWRQDTPPDKKKKLSEPSGSRICRRNILALACILVLAGIAGIDPRNLSVFGVELSGPRADYVLGVAAILAQFYWYAMRYHHLIEDGTVPGTLYDADHPPKTLKLSEDHGLETKAADLLANRVAAILTFISWVFIAFWIFCPDRT